jgi:predicted alpha/beta hydrolase family esterase
MAATAAAARAAWQDGPVVLVAHSYGGAIITGRARTPTWRLWYASVEKLRHSAVAAAARNARRRISFTGFRKTV